MFFLFRNLGSPLVVLGLALVADAISHTIIIPFTPYMVQYWEPQLAWQHVGFSSCYISAAAFLGNSISYCIWETISERISRKYVILFGCLCISSSLLALGLCTSLYTAIFIRLFMGLCNGVMAASRLTITEVCSAQQQSVLNVTWSLGLILGPSLSLLLPLKNQFNQVSFTALTNLKNPIFAPCCFGAFFSFLAFLGCLVYLPRDEISRKRRASYHSINNEEELEEKEQIERLEEEDEDEEEEEIPKRFINACEGNKLIALKRWKETKKWKKELNLNNILLIPHPSFSYLKTTFQHYFCGRSFDGYPVYYEFLPSSCFDILNKEIVSLNNILFHYILLMEFCWKHLEPLELGKIILVLDLSQLQLIHTKGNLIETVSSIVQILQIHYPERLEKAFLINSPFWFTWVWKSLIVSIEKKTIDKIVFLKKEQVKEELLKYLSIENLPKEYQGKAIKENSSEEKILKALISTSSSFTSSSVTSSSSISLTCSSSYVPSSLSDSEEEDFFDCNEYGLSQIEQEQESKEQEENEDQEGKEQITKETKEQEQLSEDQEDSSHFLIPSQLKHESIEEIVPKKKRERSKQLPNLTPLSPLIFSVNKKNKEKENHPLLISSFELLKKKSIQSNTRKKHRRLSASDDDLVSSLQLMKEKTVIKVLLCFSLWIFVQNCFDELYPLWCFSRRSKGDFSFSSSSTGISLAFISILLLIFDLYFFPNMLARTQPKTIFRISLLFQIPFFLGFPFLDLFSKERNPWIWIFILLVLLIKQFSQNIAFSSIFILLDNSVGTNRRPSIYRLAITLLFISKSISSVLVSNLYSYTLINYESFPFSIYLIYGLLTFFLFVLWILTCTFPMSINSPRLFFLDHV